MLGGDLQSTRLSNLKSIVATLVPYAGDAAPPDRRTPTEKLAHNSKELGPMPLKPRIDNAT